MPLGWNFEDSQQITLSLNPTRMKTAEKRAFLLLLTSQSDVIKNELV